MTKARQLMNAVFDFEQADADVAKNGWTPENEQKWECAKMRMSVIAHQMNNGGNV